MACPSERCAVHPSRLKAERIELLSHYVSDLAHTREVHRPAVDVDETLEQSQPFRVPRINGCYDCSLRSIERSSARRLSAHVRSNAQHC
jgi:hypothetical protein